MPGPGAYLIGDEERKEVMDVLETGYVSRYGGEDDPRFKRKVVTLEQEFAKMVGVQHTLAVSGGTGALMASLMALGVKPGVEVLVPGYTYVASMSAIISVGGTPVFTEIDESLTMDPEDIERKMTPRTKVVMPVHTLGNPANMNLILEIARKHDLLVLEDCCQGLGGAYQGKKLGSIGAMGAFSLNINKTITSGDGGMVTTNDRTLYERAFGYHDQGHLPFGMGVKIGGQPLIGINLRMNELTGGFALGQMKKLDRILALLKQKKLKFKKIIEEAGLKEMSFRKINDPGECHTLVTILFKDGDTARRVAKTLRTKTVAESGWHVYNEMEQILSWTDGEGRTPFRKHMLPQTDDILGRAINLSVGVVDPGLGAGFGINILSDDEEIEQKAREFVRTVRSTV